MAAGVLGRRVGGGHGGDAMTALGASGGALAGRAVERRQRSTTVYEFRIRRDEGGSRRFSRDQAYAVAQTVWVEGDPWSLRN